MILYDNLDDVKAKLIGTYVYYKGEVAYVKDAKGTAKGYSIAIQEYEQPKLKWIMLDDPEFNYTRYNLGYVNYGSDVAWWCRIPAKQYQQGLRPNQMKCVTGDKNLDFMPQIQFSGPTVRMLKDDYPSLDQVVEPLRIGYVRSMAFHRNFAVSWDRIHEDFLLEYKGRIIGHMKDESQVKLLGEFDYLKESVNEVLQHG